jgi:hypothetical protein
MFAMFSIIDSRIFMPIFSPFLLTSVSFFYNFFCDLRSSDCRHRSQKGAVSTEPMETALSGASRFWGGGGL